MAGEQERFEPRRHRHDVVAMCPVSAISASTSPSRRLRGDLEDEEDRDDDGPNDHRPDSAMLPRHAGCVWLWPEWLYSRPPACPSIDEYGLIGRIPIYARLRMCCKSADHRKVAIAETLVRPQTINRSTRVDRTCARITVSVSPLLATRLFPDRRAMLRSTRAPSA